MLAGRRGHAMALGLLVLVPLVFFWEMVVDGQEPLAPDTQAARPLTEWARQARAELEGMPLWCPAIFSGMPSYGSFIHTPGGPQDLVRNLRLLCGGNRGLQYFLSMMIGALALYLLLHLRGSLPVVALTGALVFIMTPYMLGLIAAGHSTKLHALCLAPLVWLACELLLRRRRMWAAAFLAISVALQLWNNHPQITYYTLLLCALYVLGVLLCDRPARWRGRGLALGLALGALGLALAAALALEPYAAVLEYTPHSIRGAPSVLDEKISGTGVGWDYATAWSFPPRELVSFVFPAWFGLAGTTYWGQLPFTQSTHYFGVSVLLLAVLGVVLSSDRRRWIWVALGGLILLIGFGRNAPILYRPMYELLPFFNRFRVPSMIYALLPLLAALLAAKGLNRIAADGFVGAPPRRARRGGPAASGKLGRWELLAAGFGLLLIVWLVAGGGIADGLRAGGAFLSAREATQVGAEVTGLLRGPSLAGLERAGVPQVLITWITQRMELLKSTVALGLLFLTLIAAIIAGRRRGLLKGEVALVLLGVVVIADLWVIDRKFYDPRPRRQVDAILREDAVVRFLKAQQGHFRIAPLVGQEFGSNRYSAFGIESVGGYQPAKLRTYDDVIRSGAIYSMPVLSMLGVRYLLIDRDLSAAGLPLETQVPGAAGEMVYVHRNPAALPPAWFVRGIREFDAAPALLNALRADDFDPSAEALVIAADHWALPDTLASGEVLDFDVDTHHLRTRVRVAGPGPGLLVFSEVYYAPGWVATVDEAQVEVKRVNHILRAVVLPAGEHRVEMRAVSPGRRHGVLLSRLAGAVVVLLLAGSWAIGYRRRSAR